MFLTEEKNLEYDELWPKGESPADSCSDCLCMCVCLWVWVRVGVRVCVGGGGVVLLNSEQ